jgi:RHS repeat-associated protein
VTYTRGLDLSGSMEGAGGIGGLLAWTHNGNGASAYYHSDGNGNITMLINPSQIPVAKYAYDPFGNTLAMSGPLAEVNTYRFSSKEINAASGLYNFSGRFYNPPLARWMSMDPAGMVDGPNLYAFVRNGPTYGIDPWGLMTWDDFVFYASNPGLAMRYLGDWMSKFSDPERQQWYVDNIENFDGHVPSAISTYLPSERNDAFRDALGSFEHLAVGHEEMEAIIPYLSVIPGLQPFAAVASVANGGMYAGEGRWGSAAVNIGIGAATGVSIAIATAGTTGGIVTTRSVASSPAAGRVAATAAAPRLLNQFNSVDSLLQYAGTFTRLKGGVQMATIKGNGEAIFNALAQGGQILRSGYVRLADGTIIGKHISPKFGEFTIDINRAGQLFKIRVNP